MALRFILMRWIWTKYKNRCFLVINIPSSTNLTFTLFPFSLSLSLSLQIVFLNTKKKMMNGPREAEFLLNYTDMSVLERQRVHLNYNHPGLDSTLAGFFSDSSTVNTGFLGTAGLDLPYGDMTVESDARLSISPENIKKRKFDSFLTETKVRTLFLILQIEKEKKQILFWDWLIQFLCLLDSWWE